MDGGTERADTNPPPPDEGQGPPERIRLTRRSVLRNGLLVGAGAVTGAGVGAIVGDGVGAHGTAAGGTMEPFYGAHQSGILTGTQRQVVLAAFDLAERARRADVAALLEEWTALGATLARGASARIPVRDQSSPHADALGSSTIEDSYEAYLLGPQRLTLTVGFGRSLFRDRDGRDRFGLGTRLPPALVDLPVFARDQLVSADGGGDLFLQACADDPQVAFHAVRSIDRIAPEIAALRWTQEGFSPSNTAGTPRNLMGFKDGTMNSNLQPPGDLEATLWAGAEGPAWMRGGTYLVYRRIRMMLEQWDRLTPDAQEQVIGRRKLDGAPLGQSSEFSPLDLGKLDDEGNWVVPVLSHVRIASPLVNEGAVVVRRSFSYASGTTPDGTSSPEHRGLEYDAGSLFLAYQKDPRTGFVPIYDKLANVDALRTFTTHTASAVFAVPPGASGPGDWIGRGLFT